MTDLQAIADELVAAHLISPEEGAEALGALYAETVETRHTPPAPSDGFVLGEALRLGRRQKMPLLREAISNFHTTAEARVEDDVVHFAWTYRGTMKDGSMLAAIQRCELTLRDGRIVMIVNHHDPETAPILMRLLAPALEHH